MKSIKTKLVSEIGCNHKGQFDLAKELVKLSKESGAYAVKFQKRTVRDSLESEQYKKPHPDSYHAYGATYGQHREYLEFSIEQHAELKKYAESLGVVWSTSVWDVTAAQEIIELNPEFIKIPSACNLNFLLVKTLRDEFKGDVHISLGMTSRLEQNKIVDFFVMTGQSHRLILYSCTSNYPTAFNDVCLLEISELQKKFSSVVKAIGFSGHHLGIAIDIAAATLGATWIERHFTKDRTWKGTDHAASLEPGGFSKLSRDLIALESALQYKTSDILTVEQAQFEKLKTVRTLL